MVSTRNIAIQLLIVVVMIVAYNFALVPVARSTLAATTVRRVDQTPVATRTVFVGSSVVAQGFDPQSFDAAAPELGPSANLGMHSCTVAEQYELLAISLRHATHPTLMVWGYFGNELVWTVPYDFAHLIFTRELLFYTDASIGEPIIARQNWRDALTMRVVRPFPLLTERARLWARVEWLRRKLDVIGLPRPPENSMGRIIDLNLLADEGFRPEMTEAYLSGKQTLSPYTILGIELAQRRGMKCLFVEMPLSSEQRRSVETPARGAFRAKLTADLAAHGCSTLRCTDWITDDELFEDHVHMNPRGAKQFSELLARDLLNSGLIRNQ